MKKFTTAFQLLSTKARKRMFMLIPVIVLGMCMETLSVGMIVPALGILLNESFYAQFEALHPLLHFLDNPSHEKLIFFGLISLALVFFLKNVFLYFQIHCQGTFVYSAKREIALTLFKKYLGKSYLFHLSTNSSEMLRNLTTEVNSYCNFFLMPVVNIITETLVVAGLISLIIWVEPTGSLLLLLILGLMVFLFVRATHRVVGSWGHRRLLAEEKKIKHLQQGLGAIKQILLSGKTEFFLNRFHQPNQISGLMDKREYIFQYVPKLGVEIIAVCGLVGMCSYLLWEGKSQQEITYMLGLMATAGFRLIPSFSRILNNLQSLHYGWASIDALAYAFSLTDKPLSAFEKQIGNSAAKKIKFDKEITFSKLSFSYDKQSKLLDGIEFSIRKGSTIGLTGASGCGKSTFTDLMLGLLELDSGKIVIDGQPLEEKDQSGWSSMIGYVPQDVYILDDTIRHNIAFGVPTDEIDNDRVWGVLNIVNLKSFMEQNHNDLDTFLGEHGAKLSGGQKQRLGVARALYHDPEILILDEFTSALDRDTEQEILKTFRPLLGKKTILMIAHSQYPLDLCDKIYRLENGKIKLFENDPEPVHAGN
jgi:ABC-type multidrug transport system fused ATPase/permease subunit